VHPQGHHAWHLYLDVYCLDADGSLFDCALLAAVAALADVSLPALELLEGGRLAALPAGTPAAAALPGGAARRLTLPPLLPVALTCGLYRQHCLVDPTWEEEERMHATVTAAVDAEGTIIAMHKAGGAACSEKTLMRCIAAARLRHAELTKVLAAAGVGGGVAPMDAQA
jgi:exosome complex component RRP43